jgi:dCMP deaminase
MILNPEVEKKSQEYWDIWFLRLAQQYSTGSKDPSTKVGCVIVEGKTPISFGYNGFGADHSDQPLLYKDKTYKYNHITHAEVNAIEQVLDTGYSDLTLYVSPYQPCEDCARAIRHVGYISRVVSTDYLPERWQESCNTAKILLEKSLIKVDLYPITVLL